jgi:DNA-binding MarR family transcriptional regulator
MKNRATSSRSKGENAEDRTQNEAFVPLVGYIPFLLTQTVLRRARVVDQIMQTIDLTEPEIRLLIMLEQYPGTTITTLAEWAVIERSTLSRMLARMEKAGLLERRRRDGRTVRVLLTEKGEDLTDQAKHLIAGCNDSMFRGLSKDDIEAFKKTLRTLLMNLGGVNILGTYVGSSSSENSTDE